MTRYRLGCESDRLLRFRQPNLRPGSSPHGLDMALREPLTLLFVHGVYKNSRHGDSGETFSEELTVNGPQQK
jgi:hypothetical protein